MASALKPIEAGRAAPESDTIEKVRGQAFDALPMNIRRSRGAESPIAVRSPARFS